MVKVIGRDNAAIKRITCRSCASVLEYTIGEVRSIKHSYDYLGDYEISQGFVCPNCNETVFVNRS